jgi:hypothetical protein
MRLTRRDAILGGAAAVTLAALPGFTLPAAAATGTRRLELYRGGSRIGEKEITVRRDGDTVTVTTGIAIAVRVLGLTAYRYTLESREIWENGQLARLDARTNDDGTAHFARAERSGDGLSIEGSEYRGTVAGTPATTTYWSPAFLERPVWISTQDGRPWRVQAQAAGTEPFPTAAGSVNATRWRVRGDLDLDLFYDGAGEWVGTEFEARGETARFVLASRGAALRPLWGNA